MLGNQASGKEGGVQYVLTAIGIYRASNSPKEIEDELGYS